MKLIFIAYVFATSLFCGRNTENKESIKEIEKSEITNTSILSISYTEEEIKGGNYYGHKYEFNINVNSSSNLDILNFCIQNMNSILTNRIEGNEVITSVMNELNSEEKIGIGIDQNPTGLRLGTATSQYDSVEIEIYVKQNNLLYMDLKYYYPL